MEMTSGGRQLKKEEYAVWLAYKILNVNEKDHCGWSKVTSHLVFDAKAGFNCKEIWDFDGHTSDLYLYLHKQE